MTVIDASHFVLKLFVKLLGLPVTTSQNKHRATLEDERDLYMYVYIYISTGNAGVMDVCDTRE